MQASGLKVLVGGTLVVPPFECAWLTGADLTFADGTGCICFEAKADTDVTVILKATPGARRLQPLQRADGLHGAHAQGAAAAAQSAVEPNYTVIFGSHRNSCLKFEKNGSTLTMAQGVPGAHVSGKEFLRFWVHYSAGTISVGTGEPSLETLSYRWRDEDPSGPIPGIRHVGLSCWDRHACYRAIRLHPKPLSLPADLWGAPLSALAAGADGYAGGGTAAGSAGAAGAGEGGLLTPLLQLCCRAAQGSLLGPSAVCGTLLVAELLRPNTRQLYRSCLSALARNLLAVHKADPLGLACLSPSCLVDLLQQNDIPLGEKVIFDIVVDWAHGYFNNAVGLWCRVHDAASPNQASPALGAGVLLADVGGAAVAGMGAVAAGPGAGLEAAVATRAGAEAGQGLSVAGSGGSVSGAPLGTPSAPERGAMTDAGAEGAGAVTEAGAATEAGPVTEAGTTAEGAGAGGSDVDPMDCSNSSSDSDATAAPIPSCGGGQAGCCGGDATATSNSATAGQGGASPAVALTSGAGTLLGGGSPRASAVMGSTSLTASTAVGGTSPGAASTIMGGATVMGGGSPRASTVFGSTTVVGGTGPRRSAELPQWHAQQLAADVSMVLSMIRYPLMTTHELQAVRQCPLVCSHPEVLALVDEAMGLPIQAWTTGSAGPGAGVGASVDSVGKIGRAGSGAEGAAWLMEGAAEQAQITVTASATPGSVFCVENKRLLRSSLEGHMQLAHPSRYQRRCVPASWELAYVCDGDQNGVLRYIGTSYGTQEWVNPVLSKRIDIKASSPTSRLTDPKALAGDKFVRHNFAGPRYVNGQAVTWWCVDLGPNHQLLVNYYTLRQDGCTDYPRNWALQGSQDCSEWVDLRRHTSDNALRKPGQYASWPVLGPAASTPYRAFRFVLTGPTTSSTAPWAFCLSNLELYGYLTRLDAAPATAAIAGPGVGAGPAEGAGQGLAATGAGLASVPEQGAGRGLMLGVVGPGTGAGAAGVVAGAMMV